MIYINNLFPENNEYITLIEKLNELQIGHSRVYLNGECHRWECNLGNLITDAFVNYKINMYVGTSFTDVPIGLMAAKNIKSHVILRNNIFNEDLLDVFDPHHRLVTIQIEGNKLKKVIEESLETGMKLGLFLQVSGLHIRYDRRNPKSRRLVALLIRCDSCNMPAYTDLNMKKVYQVITTIDMTDGTLGHYSFGNYSKIVQVENVTDFLAIRAYMKQMKHINIGRMERIRIIKITSAGYLTKSKMNRIALFAMAIIALKYK